MPTDISNIKRQYKTVTDSSNLPYNFSITFRTKVKEKEEEKIIEKIIDYEKVEWNGIGLRYGTNPNQPCAFYRPKNDLDLSIGNLEFLKMGKGGPSLTNLQDMNNAIRILKYFNKPSCAVMKHLNPSGVATGFATQTKDQSLAELYARAWDSDSTSAFGSVVGFNTAIDKETAEKIMSSFVEGVVAPSYEEGVINILRRNEGTTKLNNAIRVAKVPNLDKIPKFDGDKFKYLCLKPMEDGSTALEVPYLTSIRGKEDLILDPAIKDKESNMEISSRTPSDREIRDMLTAWYININVRSNGIVFVKDGRTLGVGTGKAARILAVKDALKMAVDFGHEKDLERAVMSSDAFFPDRDCIDAIAKYHVMGVIFPAGSKKDLEIIKAANNYNISLAVTGERCFAHF